MSSHKSVCHAKKPGTQLVLPSSLCSLTYTCCPNCSETSWEVMLSPKDYCSIQLWRKEREAGDEGNEVFFRTVEVINKAAKELNPSSSTTVSAGGRNNPQPQCNKHSTSSDEYIAVESLLPAHGVCLMLFLCYFFTTPSYREVFIFLLLK